MFQLFRNPSLRRAMETYYNTLFSVTDGHDHDGLNSKVLSPAAVIAGGSVNAAALTDNAVTTAKITDGAVTAGKIAAQAVTEGKLGDLGVTTGKIANKAVTAGKMADATITASQIAASAVETAKINNLAVTAGKLGALAVETAKIDNLAVTSGKIAAGAVIDGKLAADSVNTTDIKDLNVTTAKLAAGAVAAGKLNADMAGDGLGINGGTGALEVNVDDSTIETNSDALRLKDAGTTLAKLAALARGHLIRGSATARPEALDASADGQILIGNGNDIASVAVTGDVSITNAGVTAIGAGAVDTAMLAAITTPTAKTIADPGTGNAIPVTGNGDVALTIADAVQTNTLAVPTFAGQIITISADTLAGSGTRAVTVAAPINVTGNTIITFNAAGEFISLYGIKLGASFAWRVLASDSVVLS